MPAQPHRWLLRLKLWRRPTHSRSGPLRSFSSPLRTNVLGELPIRDELDPHSDVYRVITHAFIKSSDQRELHCGLQGQLYGLAHRHEQRMPVQPASMLFDETKQFVVQHVVGR